MCRRPCRTRSRRCSGLPVRRKGSYSGRLPGGIRLRKDLSPGRLGGHVSPGLDQAQDALHRAREPGGADSGDGAGRGGMAPSLGQSIPRVHPAALGSLALVPLLLHQPPLFDILPLYVVFGRDTIPFGHCPEVGVGACLTRVTVRVVGCPKRPDQHSDG